MSDSNPTPDTDARQEQSIQNASAEPILKHFRYAQLPERLQEVSRQFHDLAHNIVATLPRDPERTVALRKLLEGKDAAVRAALPPDR